MDRRAFVTGLGAVLAAPLAARAQQARKVWRIGWLGPPPTAGGLLQAFQQSLRDLRYVDGQNVRIDYRYTDVPLQGHADLFPQLAAELVSLRPDVLVVSITEAAVAAKNATSAIPIVMVNIPDPVAAGLVSSLARPGGNVTGLSRQSRDIVGKNFQLLSEILPKARHFAALVNPRTPLSSQTVTDAKEAARSLGIDLTVAEAEHRLRRNGPCWP